VEKQVYRGGHPFQARPQTIRLLKERRRGRRALVAVKFEDGRLLRSQPWPPG
jgi:hypothetical protein